MGVCGIIRAMRRLLRWAFRGAASVSAVLCAATCVLWAATHRTLRLVNANMPYHWVGIDVFQGELGVGKLDFTDGFSHSSSFNVSYESFPCDGPGQEGVMGFFMATADVLEPPPPISILRFC